MNQYNVPNDIYFWEGYDNSLTPMENLIELELQMGIMNKEHTATKDLIERVKKKVD